MRFAAFALCTSVALLPQVAQAGFTFASIDGGEIDLANWMGRPVLVVNTASLCGFTGQYEGLQVLHDLYGPDRVLVLAVPSDDFAQELADDAAVKEFCAVNFDLTLPMTEITQVKGTGAHPFYQWVEAQSGFVPGWNFNKVLVGPEGRVVATWGAAVPPDWPAIRAEIDALLP